MRLYDAENNERVGLQTWSSGSAREAPYAVRVPGSPAQHDHREVGVDARREAVGVPNPVEQRQPAAVVEDEVEHHQRRLAHLDRA
jgi:hypothetical protein